MRSSTLEDAIEALIGAIYLDGGIDSTRKVVLNWVEGLWGNWTENISRHNPKDKFRNGYRRICRTLKIKYKIISESGPDHAKNFDAEIFIDQ